MPRRQPPHQTRPEVTHLYRGASAVRYWSKYKKTNREWSLCGFQFPAGRCVEEAAPVTCRYCRELLRHTASRQRPTKPERSPCQNQSRQQLSRTHVFLGAGRRTRSCRHAPDRVDRGSSDRRSWQPDQAAQIIARVAGGRWGRTSRSCSSRQSPHQSDGKTSDCLPRTRWSDQRFGSRFDWCGNWWDLTQK